MDTAVHPIPLGASVAFFIVGTAGPVLVDAGLPGTEWRVWTALRRHRCRPQDLCGIVLTHAHFDHCGNLAALLQESKAPLAAHPQAAVRLRGEAVPLPAGRTLRGRMMAAFFRLFSERLRMPAVPVGRALADGESLADWGLPAEVLYTPGHTADSLTLLLAGGVALVGDLLTQQGRRAGPQPYFVEDDAALAQSLERLQERRPQVVYTGHSTRPLVPVWPVPLRRS